MAADFFTNYSEVSVLHEESPIRNLEYSTEGELLAYTAGGLLKIYDARSLALCNIITAEIDNSKFFQRHTMIQSVGSYIFHHSIYDNKYLNKFDHSEPVRILSVDPFSDLFMSVGHNKSYLWDIRMKDPTHRIIAPGHIGCLGREHHYSLYANGILKIFDIRNNYGPIHSVVPPFGSCRTIWFADQAIIIANRNAYASVDQSGKVSPAIVLEGNTVGDTTPDSSILVCSAKKYLMAYKIENRIKIGNMGTSLESCDILRINPGIPQLACSAPGLVKIYSE